MKLTLFLSIFLCAMVAFGDAVIFSGNDVKALKYNLDLFGRSKVRLLVPVLPLLSDQSAWII